MRALPTGPSACDRLPMRTGPGGEAQQPKSAHLTTRSAAQRTPPGIRPPCQIQENSQIQVHGNCAFSLVEMRDERPLMNIKARWAVHFFLTYREVGELEIALSFASLQMSWGR